MTADCGALLNFENLAVAFRYSRARASAQPSAMQMYHNVAYFFLNFVRLFCCELRSKWNKNTKQRRDAGAMPLLGCRLKHTRCCQVHWERVLFFWFAHALLLILFLLLCHFDRISIRIHSQFNAVTAISLCKRLHVVVAVIAIILSPWGTVNVKCWDESYARSAIV